MKLNLAVGRKGARFKVLYCGEDADMGLSAMAEALDDDKPKFVDVAVYKRPLHYRRRKLMA